MSDVPKIEVKVISTDTSRPAPARRCRWCLRGRQRDRALTGVRVRERPFATDRVSGALGAESANRQNACPRQDTRKTHESGYGLPPKTAAETGDQGRSTCSVVRMTLTAYGFQVETSQ